jgi:hypothetical protein
LPDNRLREAWHAREWAVPISAELNFTRDGLVLGAGTVIVPAEGPRLLKSLDGEEARVLALLSAAYGKAVPPSVLGNIRRAAKAWHEGDDCLAYVHLARGRLGELTHPHDAAQCLVIVDAFLNAGGGPRTIFEALKVSRSYVDALEKDYNPNEPRVPAGSGRTSGEWTRDGVAFSPSPPSYLAPGAASRISGQWTRLLSWFVELDSAQLVELGLYVARVLTPAGGAAAVFGLLFIPSPNDVRVEGEVAGIRGLRYSWNRDETQLHLTYDYSGGGQRTFAAYLDGDDFRDEHGEIIGHVIGGNKIAIYLSAVFPDLVKSDEPRLCPAYAPDVAGSDQGKSYEENISRQYEDFLKPMINPDAPTPSGYVYYLPKPGDGEPVSYDDCQRKRGILFEYKAYYGTLLTFDSHAVRQFLDQSARQVAASAGRPIVWIFAEKATAEAAERLFKEADEGREYITIVDVPWTK